MSQAAGGARVLPYSSFGANTFAARRWRQLLWLGVVHLAAMVGLIGVSVPGMQALVQTLGGQPRGDWFVMAMLAQAAAMFLMMLVNGLAVAGYATAVRGRSPRRWFLAYAPTQLALMALQYALLIVLVAASPHSSSPTSSIGVSQVSLFIMPVAFVILNLPLFLLLLPRIRRACFAG
jgi:hypothetical protein